MTDDPVTDELWEDFHRWVNMTSRELHDWLAAESAGEEAETFPDQAGPELGRHVVEILGKRRGDLTRSDVAVMEKVVDRIHSQRGDEPAPTAGGAQWRRALMDVGHDPLKEV